MPAATTRARAAAGKRSRTATDSDGVTHSRATLPPPPILRDPNPGLVRWVLHAIYDTAWLVVILLTSPWWIWRSLTDAEFRAMARARLALGLTARPRTGRRCVLVHGVSVG